MNFEARFYCEKDIRDYTPATAKVAGQVVVLDDGKAGICIDAIAANAKGAVQVSGIVEMNNAAINGAAGSPIGWDEDASPVSGTASSGAATTKLSAVDFLLGSLASALASTDTSCFVNLNDFNPAKPIFEGKVFEEITTSKTLDAEDCGKAFIVTADAQTITLPATGSGLGSIVIINGCADGGAVINISPAAVDKIMGPDLAGVDNKDLINTKATAKHWDYVIIHPDVAGNGWEVLAKRGTWAAEA